MMRGFRYVGRVGDDVIDILADVPPDSMIALSPGPDGPMRDGCMRSRDTHNTPFWHWPIVGAGLGDYVFVATAIGESAFRTGEGGPMSVIVAGLEQFVGNIKARYRRRGAVSDDPEPHHKRFHDNHTDGMMLVDHGVVDEATWHSLVETWESDSRELLADPVWLTTGYVSYMLYVRTQQ